MTLPAEYTPLPFQAARGVPQTVPFDAGSRRLRLTVLATVTDLPALRTVAATHIVFDGGAGERTRPTSVPREPRQRFLASPPSTLAPAVVRPHLVVSDGTTTLGSQSILVGTPAVVGATAEASLLVEVLFDRLVLTAGSLIQPGEFGGTIVAGARIRNIGVKRFENAPGTLQRKKPKKKVKAPESPLLSKGDLFTQLNLALFDVGHVDISAINPSDLVTLLPGDRWWV